ncbi:ribose-5-phosphate isomerase RpiA [Thalassobacillus pellis]|uniref:ribose-5-phosphate isomerase RpiA n=1 Tax=Thalassobacillus pellis TaxID=748008 RepID=UPI001EF8F218|nr:ribose-5-phosphate isomerase RpiA [Thalassobacillus pellis]MBM7554231.1 ribose 5-phosphate isomerase A [Thalassobacillus pellis]
MMAQEKDYEKIETVADMGKRKAAEQAVSYVEDGMVIGLGSGSTVYWMMKKLGEHVKEGLQVKGIPSSVRTENWAQKFGIPLTGFDKVQELDVAIDGADEIDPFFQLLKGGGGSLVREKIVNTAAKQVITIADEGKYVKELGKRPLPVEVLPFGWEVTAKRITQLKATVKLREKEGNIFISDNGNYIIDCKFPAIDDPYSLHNQLVQLAGVVETGLFLDLADIVILGGPENVRYLEKPNL